MNDCLLICELDINDLMCVWFLFFSSTNDVSTLQKDDYCRNHWDVENSKKKIDVDWIDWLEKAKKSSIDWDIVQTNWLIDWLSKQKKSIFDCHSRKLTMRIVKMKCNHRFQRKNFKLTIFFWFAYFYEWFDDFFLNTRVFLRAMKTLFLLALSTSNWRFSLISRIFTSVWRFYFAYSRISTSNSLVEAERLIECQLISQNSKREICCAKNNESSSLRLIEKFRAENEIVTSWIALKTSSSQIDRFCFFLLADRLIASVKFISFVTMKIKYNVKRMSRKQIA